MLDSYRLVVATAESMLMQARSGRWDEVARTASTIVVITTAIDQARRAAADLSPADEAERVRLLARLVRIDAEVRQLRQPWALRLDTLLGATPRRAARDAHTASGGPPRHT